MKLNSYCDRQIDCIACPNKSKGVLVHHHYPQGQHFPAEKCTENCMIFMLKGELLVNSKEHPGTTLKAEQIILQSIGSTLELLTLTEAEYIVYRFTELPLICKEKYEQILKNAKAPMVYTPLPFIPLLARLLEGVVSYFQEQPAACSGYIDLKCRELVYILTCYYPLPQISAFFHPISLYTESFHYFVMQNYGTVKNVEEFAHRGGYTTATFRRLFKNMYGVPVYEWILDKKREGILADLLQTKQRVSVISARYGFDSLSHFAHFCKDSFGDTPRSLRKRAANGETISIICKEPTKKEEEENE